MKINLRNSNKMFQIHHIKIPISFDNIDKHTNLVNEYTIMRTSLHNILELNHIIKTKNIVYQIIKNNVLNVNIDITFDEKSNEMTIRIPQNYKFTKWDEIVANYIIYHQLRINEIEVLIEQNQTQYFIDEMATEFKCFIKHVSPKAIELFNKIVSIESINVNHITINAHQNGDYRFLEITENDKIFSITIRENVIKTIILNNTKIFPLENSPLDSKPKKSVIDLDSIEKIFNIIDEVNTLEIETPETKIKTAINMLKNNPEHIEFTSDCDHQITLNIKLNDKIIELTSDEVMKLINDRI